MTASKPQSDSRETANSHFRATPLIAVGLTIAAGLAVWMVVLALSVPEIRARQTQAQLLDESLNEFEGAIERVESELSPVENSRPSSDVEARVLERISNLESLMQAVLTVGQEVRNDQVADRLANLQYSTGQLLLAARHQVQVLDVPADAGEFASFEKKKAPVERDLRTTTASVHLHRFELASTLVGKLWQIIAAGTMAVALAIWFAGALVWRMHSSAKHHSRSMNALHESKEQFRLLAENIPGVVYLCLNDERYTMTFISEGVNQLTGYSREDFLADRKSFVDLFHPDDAPKIAPEVDKAVAANEPFELDYRIKHADGSWRWIHEVGVGVSRNGKVEYLEGFLTDVTERMKWSQELLHQKEYLRQVIDLDPNLIFAKDRNGVFTLVNRSLAQVYGTTVENLEGKTDADFNPNVEEVESFRRDDLEVMDTGEEKFIPEEMVTDSEGRVRWYQTYKRALKEASGDSNQVLGVAAEITALKRAERIMAGRTKVLERMTTGAPLEDVLAALASGFQDALPSHRGAVALFNHESNRVELAAAPDLSPNICRALASCQPEAIISCGRQSKDGAGAAVADLASIDGHEALKSVLIADGFRSCWTQWIRSDEDVMLGAFMFFGTVIGEPERSDIEILSSAAQIAAIAIQRKRDEEELKESQARLRAADRLASIGTLTAGLGHDMNNVLFPLRCRLETLDVEKVPTHIAEVLRATRDTINYIQQLSDGLRLLAADPDHSDATSSATNVNQWWSQVSSLIRDALPRNIKLISEIEENLPPVAVASHRLTQAVLNLAVNAAEATEDDSPVEVWARQLPNGSHVEIGVTDHGVGMTSDVRTRALDPFFTTKTRALSTGLGLSLVHGVVKACGGSLDIKSTPGVGTTVVLRIPRQFRGQTEPSRPRQAVVSLSDSRTAGWVRSVLKIEGYNVLQASNGGIPDSDLWVTDASDRNLEIARRYVDRAPRPQVIVFGDATADWSQLGAMVVRSSGELANIKSAVRLAQQRADELNDVK